MECIKEENSRYCLECDCETKKCFRCQEHLTLNMFEVCRKAHVRRIKANKERVYLCKECVPLQQKELKEKYGE